MTQGATMPMTARLLQRLSDTLGEDATNDLLGFIEGERTLNRTEFRQIAESYFDRFDALLRQEGARVDGAIHGLRKDLTRLEIQLGSALAEQRAEFKAGLADQRADLLKWMFLFWAGTVMPLAGLMVALSRR
jgi:hypothetical protein